MSRTIMQDPKLLEQARVLAEEVRARGMQVSEEDALLIGMRWASTMVLNVAEALRDDPVKRHTFNVRMLRAQSDYAGAAQQALAEFAALFSMVVDSALAQRQVAETKKGTGGKLS